MAAAQSRSGARCLGSNGQQCTQPQNFAKRLLDQLGDVDGKPIIYTDDRQVCMLFVRVDEHRSTTTPPTIFFAAQRSSLVREAVRFAHDRRDEDRDDYWDREIDWQQGIDAAEDAVDTWRGVESDMGRRWYARELYNLQFLTQRSVIDGVDDLVAYVVQSYASLRPRDPHCFADLTAGSIDLLASMPYVMNLGPMPAKAGDTEQFQSNLRFVLADRISRYPVLYPLLGRVGLAVFFFPGPAGKDLDNIFRLVVPTLLEQLHPPPTSKDPHALPDNQFQFGDAVRRRQAIYDESHIAFIKAISLKGLPYPPGTDVIALSGGARQESWWQLAIDGASLRRIRAHRRCGGFRLPAD